MVIVPLARMVEFLALLLTAAHAAAATGPDDCQGDACQGLRTLPSLNSEDGGLFDCVAGYPRRETGWSSAKKNWCCKERDVGCPYDCEAGVDNWHVGWSNMKKTWCCEHKEVGCRLFDCVAGHSNWELGWSHAKKEWCCQNENVGCQFNCQAGASNAANGWSEDKKTWCCTHEQIGCTGNPAPTTIPTSRSILTTPPAPAAHGSPVSATTDEGPEPDYAFVGYGTAREAHSACAALGGTLPMPKTAARQAALQQGMARAVEAGKLSQWQWPNNTVWLGAKWVHDGWLWDDGVPVGDGEYASQRLASIAASSVQTGQHDSDPWLCMVLEGIWHDSLPFHKFGIMCQIASTSTPVTTTNEVAESSPGLRGLPDRGWNSRTKKIVGGVVGGSVGAVAVGLLGGLLGAKHWDQGPTSTTTTMLWEPVTTTTTIMLTNTTGNARTLWNNATGNWSWNISQESEPNVAAIADDGKVKVEEEAYEQTLPSTALGDSYNVTLGALGDSYNVTLGMLEGAIDQWWGYRWAAFGVATVLLGICLIAGLVCACKGSSDKYGSSLGDQSPTRSEGSPSRSRAGQCEVSPSPSKQPMLSEATLADASAKAAAALAPVTQWLPLGSRQARTLNMSPDKAQQSNASVQSFFEVWDHGHEETQWRGYSQGSQGTPLGRCPASATLPLAHTIAGGSSLSAHCMHDVSISGAALPGLGTLEATRASICQNLAASFREATVPPGAGNSINAPVTVGTSRSQSGQPVWTNRSQGSHATGSSGAFLPGGAGSMQFGSYTLPISDCSSMMVSAADGNCRGSPSTSARSHSLHTSPPSTAKGPRGGVVSPRRERSPTRVVRRSASPIRRIGTGSPMTSPRVVSPIRVRSPMRGRPSSVATPGSYAPGFR